MDNAIALIIFANSIQMAIFAWMLAFPTDKQQATAIQIYVRAWQNFGAAIWKFSFAPVFKRKKSPGTNR